VGARSLPNCILESKVTIKTRSQNKPIHVASLNPLNSTFMQRIFESRLFKLVGINAKRN